MRTRMKRSNRSISSIAVRSGVLLAILLLLASTGSVSAGTVGARASAPREPTSLPDAALLAYRALSAASASVASGAGPALGNPLHCTLRVGSASHCAPLSPRPLNGPPANTIFLNISTLSPTSPGQLGQYSMVYDAADSEVLLFGGQNSSANSANTWVFQEGVWTQLKITGPSARTGAAIAYDALDKYVLLFGGGPNQASGSDTWTFSGGIWTQLLVKGLPIIAPNMTWGAAMAYDPTDQYIVMFGGWNSTTFTDMAMTWKFAGGTWTNLSIAPASEPSPRQTHVMAWDTADSYMVLFGGLNAGSGKPLNDTWKFTGGAWTLLAKGPKTLTPRFSMGMDYDPTMGGLVMFGGANINTALNDTWFFNGGTWTKMNTIHVPSNRGEASVTWDALDGYAIIYGGSPDFGLDFFSGAYSIGPNLTAGFAAVPSVIEVGQNTSLRAEAVGDNSNPASFNYVYTNLPTGCTSANQTPLNCSPSVAGAFIVSVRVSDPKGNYRTANASLTVNTATNIASFILSPSTLTPGQRLTLSVTVAGGTSPYTYAYLGLPPGCSSLNVPSFNCTPASTGNYSITAKVVDSLGYPATLTVSLTVDPNPSIRSFSVTPSTIRLGANATFNVSVNGGIRPLAYLYTGLPNGCSSTNASTLPCTPTTTGNFTVHVFVRDSGGNVVNSTTSLLVTPVLISSFTATPSALEIGSSTLATTTLVVVSTGGIGAITYAYAGLPAGCSSANTSSLSCTPTSPGAFTLQVVATDGAGNTGMALTSLSVAARLSGVLTASPNPTDVGAPVSFAASPTGGIGPDHFSWNFGDGSGAAAQNVSHPYAVNGSFRAQLWLNDSGGGSAYIAQNVVVDPALTVVLTVSNATPLLGQTILINATASGGAGPYSYSYLDLPPGCVSVNSPSIGCLPTQAGFYNFSVIVTDLNGVSSNASTGFQLIFDFTVVAPTLATVHQPFRLVVKAGGGYGKLTYNYTGLPSGCPSVDAAQLTCTPNDIGVYNISISVHDALGEHASHSVKVEVLQANSMPFSSPLIIGGAGAAAVLAIVALLVLSHRRKKGGAAMATPKEPVKRVPRSAIPPPRAAPPKPKGRAPPPGSPGNWDRV
ncbi:MAG: PKD domain-containing protein [Candidatus Lutacidiplasmatales archaeon]